MSAERLAMKTAKELLRLTNELGLSDRVAARGCRVSHTNVGKIEAALANRGKTVAEALVMNEATLEHTLYGSSPGRANKYPDPDWRALYEEYHGHPDMTLQLLWDEYANEHPDGLKRSQFCERFRKYVRGLRTWMRQEHRGGEKVFVDYAGRTMPILDAGGGETRQAQIFVGTLGASNYTYAEATWTQKLGDWLGSHVRMFEFFGGCPQIVTPDNLKSAVTHPCRYDPELNPCYCELARHYQIAVIPARPRRPRDKAKVEVGVQIVQRWILARLRHQQFFSLGELNTAIRSLLDDLNMRPLKKYPGSRRNLFEKLDQPNLRSLPSQRYEFATIDSETVGPDYLVDAGGNRYSVPCELVGRTVDVRLTTATVEIFHRGERIASHVRHSGMGQCIRLSCHMPPGHRAWAERTLDSMREWGDKTGAAVGQVIKVILERPGNSEVLLRQAEGIRALVGQHGAQVVEEACLLALQLKQATHRFVRRHLQQHRRPRNPVTTKGLGLVHENVRGPGFYS
jgi:transposase